MSDLSLLRYQSVTETTPQSFLRHRQPQLQSVLRWPFRQRSRKPSRPQRIHLLLRRRLLTQLLPPSLLLPPSCRRSLPKKREREFITRRMRPGPAVATNILMHRVTARVVRVTACPIHMFKADTLASGDRSPRPLNFLEP